MIVKQLIKELEQFDKELQIMLLDDNGSLDESIKLSIHGIDFNGNVWSIDEGPHLINDDSEKKCLIISRKNV